MLPWHIMKRLILSIFIINSIAVLPLKAGILDSLFGKDSCRSYSDYTCKQLENSSYNVYFFYPDNSEDYIGVSRSLSNCNSMAVTHANRKNLKRSDGWGYICCLKTKNSECAEKHR